MGRGKDRAPRQTPERTPDHTNTLASAPPLPVERLHDVSSGILSLEMRRHMLCPARQRWLESDIAQLYRMFYPERAPLFYRG